eukprot:1176204-Prorocentrum_minimum.AAC.1
MQYDASGILSHYVNDGYDAAPLAPARIKPDTTVTHLSHNCHTTVTQLSHDCCTTVAQPMHNRCTTVAQPMHNCRTAVAQLLHYCHTTVALHQRRVRRGPSRGGAHVAASGANPGPAFPGCVLVCDRGALLEAAGQHRAGPVHVRAHCRQRTPPGDIPGEQPPFF